MVVFIIQFVFKFVKKKVIKVIQCIEFFVLSVIFVVDKFVDVGSDVYESFYIKELQKYVMLGLFLFEVNG